MGFMKYITSDCKCLFDKKADAKQKSISRGCKVFICPKCGYYNAKILKND